MQSDTNVGEPRIPSSPLWPLFEQLFERSPRGGRWLGELWGMAAQRRQDDAGPVPTTVGKLSEPEAPRDPAARVGRVYERPIAPPAAFLQWMIEHPRELHVTDPSSFGAKADEARAWRAKLFSADAARVAEAQAEGVNQLGKRIAQRGRNKWWAFEGFLRVDGCFVTDESVLFVDGKCATGDTPSTVWFPRRSQVWRHVEAAQELAGARAFGVVLAVADDAAGAAALAAAAATLGDSFPHLTAEQRAELSRHLLGFVTPADMVSRFELRTATGDAD